MHIYYLTRGLTLRAQGQSLRLDAVSDPARLLKSDLRVAAQRELTQIRQQLQASYPKENADELLFVLTPEAAARIPGLPPLLGARALATPNRRAPERLLLGQLRALKQAHPARLHYRLLLLNGFGTNLGDNLIGLTAFRQVLALLRAELPQLSVDVLLGWNGGERLARLFQGIDGIELCFLQGLSLADLGRYQALFDTGGLLDLPRYGRMPMVDWYLWWMGLDPADTAAADKRNRVAIDPADRQQVAALLPPTEGPRILINPKASVALRSLPEAQTLRLVQTLLQSWPQAQVILVQPLPLEHPRVSQLAESINSGARLAALVAAVDALIGVNTYTAHLADACSTPAVTLESSLAPDLCPYYPLVESVLLPGAEQLPAWNRMKVPEQDWPAMADAYEAAWAALDFVEVLAALGRAMDRKAAAPDVYVPRLLAPCAAPPRCPTRLAASAEGELLLPLRQRESVLAKLLDDKIAEVAAQLLCAGDTVVQVAPGAGLAALGLARRVGPQGSLVAIEPRRQLHQLLCANLARADVWHAQTHWALPEGKEFRQQEIAGLCAADESLPLASDNGVAPESVLCWPLDALALPACRLLVLGSPLARMAVLQGACQTLTRLRPVVLIGVVAVEEARSFEAWFKGLTYRVRALQIGAQGQAPRYVILLAEPLRQELETSA